MILFFYYPLSSYVVYLLSFVVIYCSSTIRCRHDNVYLLSFVVMILFIYYPLSLYIVYLLYFVVIYCLSTILCRHDIVLSIIRCRHILFIYYPLSSYICCTILCRHIVFIYYLLSSYIVYLLSFVFIYCVPTILCRHGSVYLLSSVIMILFIYYPLSTRYC
jgi:hypothetical protein